MIVMFTRISGPMGPQILASEVGFIYWAQALWADGHTHRIR